MDRLSERLIGLGAHQQIDEQQDYGVSRGLRPDHYFCIRRQFGERRIPVFRQCTNDKQRYKHEDEDGNGREGCNRKNVPARPWGEDLLRRNGDKVMRQTKVLVSRGRRNYSLDILRQRLWWH